MEEATATVRDYRNATDFRGIENMKTHLSAYYLATEKLDEHRSKRQIQKQYNQLGIVHSREDSPDCNVRELRNITKRMKKKLDWDKKFRRPEDYIQYWTQEMDLTEHEEKTLRKAVQEVGELIEYNGYSPLPLSGSIVWLIKGYKYSVDDIAELSVSTDTTIRKNGKDIFHDVRSDINISKFKHENPLKRLEKEVTNE